MTNNTKPIACVCGAEWEFNQFAGGFYWDHPAGYCIFGAFTLTDKIVPQYNTLMSAPARVVELEAALGEWGAAYDSMFGFVDLGIEDKWRLDELRLETQEVLGHE